MEEEKQQKTSLGIGLIDIEGYVYQVNRENIGSLVRVSKPIQIVKRQL